MQLGFGIPVSGSWATPATIVEICQRAEQLGYTSLWSFQRTVYPADGEIGPPYRSVHDPLAISAYVAAVTEQARIAIAIVNAPFYTPIMLAKTLTSIDVLSEGRLDVGLGLGWNPLEFAAAGVPIERRAARTVDFIAALRAIWGADPAEYDGEFYQVPRGHVDPRPVQQPHPPILLGGQAPAALQRAGRLADGWVSASRFPADQLRSAATAVREAAAEAGRDPDAIRIVVRAAVRVREQDEDRQFSGTVAKIKADFERCAEAGATELFVDLNFDEEIGNPAADPAESVRRAHAALEAFAPSA